MQMRFQAGALVAALLLASAGGAQAASRVVGAQPGVVTYIYRGSMLSGIDESGMFGVAGRDLTGVAYKAVFERDDEAPVAQGGPFTYAGQVYGSEVFGYGAGGPINAWLEIDGKSWSFSTAFPSLAMQSQTDFPDYGSGYLEGFQHFVTTEISGAIGHRATFQDRSEMHFRFAAYGTDFLSSPDYHTLTGFQTNPGWQVTAAFTVRADSYDYILQRYDYKYDAHGVFGVDSLEVLGGPQAAVPEPAAWALMIVGFGAAGATLRRRRVLAA
jgi:hypothetical protein